MQKFKKERGWRIGDRLDTWDGAKIFRAIWLPHFNCFQVWFRRKRGRFSFFDTIFTQLDHNSNLKNRIYIDEI